MKELQPELDYLFDKHGIGLDERNQAIKAIGFMKKQGFFSLQEFDQFTDILPSFYRIFSGHLALRAGELRECIRDRSISFNDVYLCMKSPKFQVDMMDFQGTKLGFKLSRQREQNKAMKELSDQVCGAVAQLSNNRRIVPVISVMLAIVVVGAIYQVTNS